MKLKGGTLYYSLLIVIFSTSLITLILLISFYNSRSLAEIINKDELERNSVSAINMYLGGIDVFKNSDTTTITINEDAGASVIMHRKKWGNYYLIKAETCDRNYKHWLIGLAGIDLSAKEKIALYMPDQGRILSLSGSTQIKGNCYLPGKTARTASIEGQQYIYKDLVSGEIKESAKKIPALNKAVLDFAKKYLEESELLQDSIIYITALDSMKADNSFLNKTIIIYNDTITNLSNYRFKGNIVLWSTKPLIVDKTTLLHDVILFAPVITFKNGYKGELQAFAVQAIKVEDNSHLGYPSQLCVIQSEKGLYNPSDTLIIEIGKSSRIDGGIMIQSHGLFSFLSLEEKTLIKGQVYIPGLVELKGDIFGSLYCENFYLKSTKARYYNHLLNVKIDNTSLSENFVGIDMLDSTKSKAIIKWLN